MWSDYKGVEGVWHGPARSSRHGAMAGGISREAMHGAGKEAKTIRWVKAHRNLRGLAGEELRHARGNAMANMVAKQGVQQHPHGTHNRCEMLTTSSALHRNSDLQHVQLCNAGCASKRCRTLVLLRPRSDRGESPTPLPELHATMRLFGFSILNVRLA